MAENTKYVSSENLGYYDSLVKARDAQKSEVPTKLTDLNNDGNFVRDAAYKHTDNNYTDTEKTKLAGVAEGAQVNVIEGVTVNGKAVAASGKTVNITVPTNNSSLTNGAGYQTASQVKTAIEGYGYQNADDVDAAIVAKGYQTADDVEEKVTAKGYQTADQVNTIVTGKGYQTAKQVDDAVVKKGYQTAAQVTTTVEGYGYQTAANVESAIAAKGYQTAANVKAAVEAYGYQTAQQVSAAIAAAGHMSRKVVAALPSTGEDNVIYLVPASHSLSGNVKDEYMWIEGKWEKVGSNETSLDGYVKDTDLVAMTTAEIDALFA